MFDFPSAALSAALLYALYNLGMRAAPEAGDADEGTERVLAMEYRETGIPTHLVNQNVYYLNVRDSRGREKAKVGFSGDPYMDAARSRLLANQTQLDEVALAARSMFNVPASTVKATIVTTLGGTLPWLPSDYVYQLAVGAHPKIGGTDMPN